MAQLVHVLGSREISQSVNAHVVEGDAGGQVVDHEIVRGVRQQRLRPVRDAAQPGAPVDRAAHVVARVALLHGPRVHRQAHTERPRVVGPVELQRECALDGIRRACEGRDEAVALALLDRKYATVPGNRLDDERGEARDRVAHLSRARLPEHGGAFDVAQQQRDGPNGKSHARCCAAVHVAARARREYRPGLPFAAERTIPEYRAMRRLRSARWSPRFDTMLGGKTEFCRAGERELTRGVRKLACCSSWCL